MSVDPDAGGFRPPRFDVVVEEGEATVVLHLSGELDLVGEPVLAAALAAVRPRALRIDLTELAFMDSTGLRALLTAAREFDDVKLRGPLQPAVQRLLDLTQTYAILPFDA